MSESGKRERRKEELKGANKKVKNGGFREIWY